LYLVRFDLDIEQAGEQFVRPFAAALSLFTVGQQSADIGEALNLQQIKDLTAYRAVLRGKGPVGDQTLHPVSMILREWLVERNRVLHSKGAILLHGREDGLVTQYAHGCSLYSGGNTTET
jgi:hypothetical protein